MLLTNRPKIQSGQYSFVIMILFEKVGKSPVR